MADTLVAHALVRAASTLVSTPRPENMEFSLKEIAEVLGLHSGSDALITGWSTDTRTVERGDLFFALRGQNFDGSTFVDQALARGAVAAVANVSRNGQVLTVPDTLIALQKVARWARDQWAQALIGVTGSAV
jgi:UDP-N-acetylmuramyl pentapeptide synthase